LEAQLLYNQAIKIFGEGDDDDDVTSGESADHETRQKSLIFRDFRVLHSDGNDKIATARRGSNYVLFFYITS